YLCKSLQVTELDGGMLGFQDFGSFGQLGRGFKFAIRVNDFGAPLALRFRLAGDGPLHLFGNVDLFDLDLGALDAPGLGVLVEDDLELGVHLFPLRENLVELELADDAAQGGLRQLRGGVLIVLHLRQREIGVDDPEVTNRVHFYRDVVAGDDVLRRNVQRFDAQRDAVEAFDGPKDQVEAG